jgi:hypothetical protein
MFCPQCGTENPEDAVACSDCGGDLQLSPAGVPQRVYAASPPTSNMALVSFIMGILGWVLLPVIGSLLAVILGHAALGEIDQAEGRIGGRGMAQAGLILGYVALGLWVLSIILFVVLPVLGCGLCGICGAFSSIFQG